MVDVEGLPRHTPAGHSLAFKLRFACFHLLTLCPSAYACGAFVSVQTALCLFSPFNFVSLGIRLWGIR